MKIGLLNIRPDYNDSNAPISLPSSCDYLASYLNENIPDCQAYVEYDVESMLEKKPDMVGLSSFTRTYTKAKNIASDIKRKYDIPVIVGGHHISAIPENLGESMDIGVLGEGEITLLEIVKLYEKGNVTAQSLAQIDGIVYRNEEGLIKRTRPRELIKDIDVLPIPYRTPYKNVKGHLLQAIFTSRGCPFRCKYCAISEFWDKIRYHSPERVIEELSNLISTTGCTEITIYDDLFGINKKRLKTLVDYIRAENIHKKVSFTCNARASIFDDEICQMFVDMNIRACTFGMESANDRILAYMKGSTTAKQNQTALDICAKYNIIAVPNFIVGFPTETQKEAADTYWFIRKNIDKVNDFRVFPACPLPGTHLWDYALEKNIVKRDYENWEEIDFFFTPDKSVYLNAEIYDQYEYKRIIEDFYSLKFNNKPFNMTTGESIEKYHYSANLVNNLDSLVKPELGSKILEITSMIKSIKEKYSHNNITTDYRKKTFPNLEKYNGEKFDYIYLIHTLEFTNNPEHEINNLKELLNDNGKIILITYNVKNPLFLMRLITGADIQNSWTEKERKSMNVYLDRVNATDSHDKFSEMKKQFSKNVYSYWGLCDKNNLSQFEDKRLEQLAKRNELNVENTKKFYIELDEKLVQAYEHLCSFMGNKLRKNYLSDQSFCNVTVLTK